MSSPRRNAAQQAECLIAQMERELNAQQYRNWHRALKKEIQRYNAKNKGKKVA